MKNFFTISLVALTFALGNTSAHAAGLWLYEQGTPDVGTASAGMTARAQDAATLKHRSRRNNGMMSNFKCYKFSGTTGDSRPGLIPRPTT